MTNGPLSMIDSVCLPDKKQNKNKCCQSTNCFYWTSVNENTIVTAQCFPFSGLLVTQHLFDTRSSQLSYKKQKYERTITHRFPCKGN